MSREVEPSALELQRFVAQLQDLGLHAELTQLARALGVTLEQVRGRNREARIVAARRACMHLVAVRRLEYSYPDLGRLFGRDHTSVMSMLAGTEAAHQRRMLRSNRKLRVAGFG